MSSNVLSSHAYNYFNRIYLPYIENVTRIYASWQKLNILPRKAKRKYLLTYKALYGSIHLF